MKRYLISLALCCCAGTTIAQNSIFSMQDTRIGVKLGTNFTYLTNAVALGRSVQLTPENGFQAGATFHKTLGKMFHLRGEALYVRQGWETISESKFDTVTQNGQSFYAVERIDLKARNAYITIPILGYVTLFKGFDMSIGPQLNFLMSSVAKGERVVQAVNGGSYREATEVVFDLQKENPYGTDGSVQNAVATQTGKLYKGFDINLNVGFSIKPIKGMQIDLRTNYGLLDAVKDGLKYASSQQMSNRTISGQISLGWDIDTKKIFK